MFKRRQDAAAAEAALSGEPKKEKKLNPNFLRFSLQDQISFAKRLAMLVKSGVPILSGLQMLRKHARTKSSKQIYGQIINDVENGQFLSTSLVPFKKIFGTFAVNIILYAWWIRQDKAFTQYWFDCIVCIYKFECSLHS